jgi:hypothetical protein
MEVSQRITPTRRFDHLPGCIGQVVMHGDDLLVLNGHAMSLREKVPGCCGQGRPSRPTRSGSRDDDTRSGGTLLPRARRASVHTHAGNPQGQHTRNRLSPGIWPEQCRGATRGVRLSLTRQRAHLPCPLGLLAEHDRQRVRVHEALALGEPGCAASPAWVREADRTKALGARPG